MRFAVIGAGSIGTLVAALLGRGGADVVLYARRPEMAAAIRRDGARIEWPLAHDDPVVRLEATSDPETLRADVVITCVKAHQLEGVVEQCGAAIAAAERVVVMQNGIPWWYFLAGDVPHAGRRIVACDPHERLAAAIPAAKVVGGVVEASGHVIRPGVVLSGAAARFRLGSPDGAPGAVAEELAAALTAGGGQGIATPDIREAIWLKLLGNLPFLPMSAITRAVPAEMCSDPEIRAFCADVMSEALALAAALGKPLAIDVEERMEQTRKFGTHVPSMLQDLLARNSLELDALTGATLELAALCDVPAPATRRLDALVRMLERSLAVRG